MDLACVWGLVPFESELLGICCSGRNRTRVVARRHAGDSKSSALPSFWREWIRSAAAWFASRAASTLELCKILAGNVERFPSTQSGSRLRATAATDFCSYLRRYFHYSAGHLEVLQAPCSSATETATSPAIF